MRRLILALALMPLAACSPAADPPANIVAGDPDNYTPTGDASPAPYERPTPAAREAPRSNARYRCIDGSKIAVAHDSANARATITRDGRRLATLSLGSGDRYVGDGHEFSIVGDAATFTQPGLPPLACTMIR